MDLLLWLEIAVRSWFVGYLDSCKSLRKFFM